MEASGTAGASGLSVDGVMGRLEFSREDMTPEAPASGDLKLVLGIRPEQITISREKTDAAQVEARVYAGMPAGSETLVSVRVGEKLITVKELGSTHYAGDETVYLSYPPKKVNVFDALYQTPDQVLPLSARFHHPSDPGVSCGVSRCDKRERFEEE